MIDGINGQGYHFLTKQQVLAEYATPVGVKQYWKSRLRQLETMQPNKVFPVDYFSPGANGEEELKPILAELRVRYEALRQEVIDNCPNDDAEYVGRQTDDDYNIYGRILGRLGECYRAVKHELEDKVEYAIKARARGEQIYQEEQRGSQVSLLAQMRQARQQTSPASVGIQVVVIQVKK